MFTENLCSTEFSKSQKKKNTEIRIAFKCFSLCSDRPVHYLTTPFRLQRLKSRNSKIIVNYESLMIWKEAVLAFLPVLPQHSPGETTKNIWVVRAVNLCIMVDDSHIFEAKCRPSSPLYRHLNCGVL